MSGNSCIKRRHDIGGDGEVITPVPSANMVAKELAAAANKVADKFDASVFAYSGAIDRDGYGALIKSMAPSENLPARTNAFLLLTTNGGEADVAYQIARHFQNGVDKFYLCVPVVCKSAGTLIALGASEIIMWGMSELGPLDVQLARRDEIGERRSGLAIRTAFAGLADETLKVYEKVMLAITIRSGKAVSFEVASNVAAKIATGVMEPVYARINPEQFGLDLRDLEVANAYGEMLVEKGGNATRETVRKLVERYPSHEFIIDDFEARKLFRNVSKPTEEVFDLITKLGTRIYSEKDPCFVQRLDMKIINPVEESGNETAGSGIDGETTRGRAKKPRDSQVDNGR